jgi:predicted AAA+ superfamily ATPase
MSGYVNICKHDFPPIKETIMKVLDRQEMRNTEQFPEESEHIVTKTVHLYETMYTRHTTLVTGPSCAGKTTIMETLKAAKTEDGCKTSIFRINPKDRPVIEL